MKIQYCKIEKINSALENHASENAHTKNVIKGRLLNDKISLGFPVFVQTADDGKFQTDPVVMFRSCEFKDYYFKTENGEYELSILTEEELIASFTGEALCGCSVRRKEGPPCEHDEALAQDVIERISS